MQNFSTARDANAGPLSEREWMYVDNRINWWLQERMTALNLLPITQIGAGKMSHEWNKFNDTGSPIFTYSYEEEALVKLTKTPTRANLIGIRIDFEVSKLEIDANGQFESQSVDAGMRKMQQFIDRAIYRGSDVKDVRAENGIKSLTGLINASGVNEIAAGGAGADADDNMTVEGDYPHTIKHMIAKEVEDFHYGPYDLVMTDGCYLQSITNKSTTTGLTDLEEIMRIPAPQAEIVPGTAIPTAIKRIIVTPNLLAATELNATGDMMIIDNKAENVDLLVNYSPTRINLYNGGLTNRLTQQFAMITGLCVRVRRPTAICITNTLTNNVLSA
jgi:uncharacterized linocin/CFP29 family protein